MITGGNLNRDLLDNLLYDFSMTSDLCCSLLRSLLYDLLRNLWSNLLRNLCYNLRSDLKQLSFYVQILFNDLGML